MSLTISVALKEAKKLLENISDVSVLEAEILLAHVLQFSRSYLHTWPDKLLTADQQTLFFDLVARRSAGEPIAYLIGHREFWSLDLIVTPDVLIPRPETEGLVEIVLQKISADNALIADLGTGSGAVALALAKTKPNWTVHATDVSESALKIAKLNAERLHISNVFFHAGKWCAALPLLKWDAIVSNPPYLAEDDSHLEQGDLRFEPRSALVSSENGLGDIRQIILGAKNYLKPGGFLMLEHGADQAKNVATILVKSGYTSTDTIQDLAGWDRITIASWAGF